MLVQPLKTLTLLPPEACLRRMGKLPAFQVEYSLGLEFDMAFYLELLRLLGMFLAVYPAACAPKRSAASDLPLACFGFCTLLHAACNFNLKQYYSQSFLICNFVASQQRCNNEPSRDESCESDNHSKVHYEIRGSLGLGISRSSGHMPTSTSCPPRSARYSGKVILLQQT